MCTRENLDSYLDRLPKPSITTPTTMEAACESDYLHNNEDVADTFNFTDDEAVEDLPQEPEEEPLSTSNDLVSTEEAASYMNILWDTTCQCEAGACHESLPRSLLMSFMKAMRGELMTQHLKRMYIGGLMHGSVPEDSGKTKMTYHLWNHEVCVYVFAKIVNVSLNSLHYIRTDFKNKGHAVYHPKYVGKFNQKVSAKNAVVQFLLRYGHDKGMPSPCSKHNHPDVTYYFLPRGTLKLNVYKHFSECASDFNVSVDYKSFCKIWKKKVTTVKIQQRGSDFCDYCTFVYYQKVVPDWMREDLIKHRQEAENERKYYIEQTKDLSVRHFTFDFAQSVHLPYFIRQPGSYYFKIGLVVRVFGVTCETSKSQMNYLIPEGSYPCKERKGGKGCNLVISLLHHYLFKYESEQKKIRFHADSCGGQNKNQFVFFYCIWRVVMGYHESLELSFMIPGHTKCTTDQNFGVMKKKFNNSDVLCMEDFVNVVNTSSSWNTAHDCRKNTPTYYNWKEFLHQFFVKTGVPKIQSGVQGMKVVKEDEKVVVYLKKCGVDTGTKWCGFFKKNINESDVITCTNMDNFIENPKEIEEKRNKYLYKEVVEKYYPSDNVELKANFFGFEDQPGRFNKFCQQMEEAVDRVEAEITTAKKRKNAGKGKGRKKRTSDVEVVAL